MRAGSETITWRYNLVGMLFGFIALLIVAQILRIQLSSQAHIFREQGDIYAGEWRTVTPARGLIYDRWGNLLAGNQTVYELGVELKDVRNPETIAFTLMGILKADYDQVFAAASRKYSLDPERPAVYAVLANNVTEEQKQRIESMALEMSLKASSKDQVPPSLRGLVFRPTLKRSYPEKELASNILGFVNEEGVGFGVEAKFNDLLAGTVQKIWVPLDPNRVEEVPEVPSGASLVLTIDREIQASMEKLLDESIEETGSSAGVIVVSDPETGEILAMATTPRLDLNNYTNYSSIFPGSTPFNKAVSQSYETGSVFKVLTMAAALDSGAVSPDTVFLDTGVFEIGGIYIYNWNSGAWGPQDMTGCMRHSLNVCLAWIASELTPSRFYSYMQAFGFGRLTGIEIAGEDPGRLKVPGDQDWYDADLATNSFGQGLSATSIQMVMAISSIANDGKMMAPHIVRSLVNNGRQYNTSPQVVGVPVSAETAHTLTDMLAVSLETESSVALVDGYRVAGKTGTAEIPTQYGYTSNMTNASFVGWGPVDDPQFLVYVWLEKPTTSPWGSVVAAPVFRQAVERLVVLMNIPPDHVREQLDIANR
jgi:cell division protein FtsI/penicillin-binding protein 2